MKEKDLPLLDHFLTLQLELVQLTLLFLTFTFSLFPSFGASNSKKEGKKDEKKERKRTRELVSTSSKKGGGLKSQKERITEG